MGLSRDTLAVGFPTVVPPPQVPLSAFPGLRTQELPTRLQDFGWPSRCLSSQGVRGLLVLVEGDRIFTTYSNSFYVCPAQWRSRDAFHARL
jgi:hypothetical protein